MPPGRLMLRRAGRCPGWVRVLCLLKRDMTWLVGAGVLGVCWDRWEVVMGSVRLFGFVGGVGVGQGWGCWWWVEVVVGWLVSVVVVVLVAGLLVAVAGVGRAVAVSGGQCLCRWIRRGCLIRGRRGWVVWRRRWVLVRRGWCRWGRCRWWGGGGAVVGGGGCVQYHGAESVGGWSFAGDAGGCGEYGCVGGEFSGWGDDCEMGW